jgi:hypothetical protein
MVTDASVVKDGWYLDDIAIAESSTLTIVSTVVPATKSSLKLSWQANTDSDFASYKVFRSLSSSVTANDTLVTTITTKSATTTTDTGLTSKTKFYYKVYVVNTSGVHTASNEVSGTTLAGLVYPFSDDMESSGNAWTAQPSTAWTRVAVTNAHSAVNVWEDSPGGNYDNNVNVSLALSDSLPYTGKGRLVFWHKLALGTGDTARAEWSHDKGATWKQLAAYTSSNNTSSWSRVQLDLTTTSGTTTGVQVRYRLTTDGSGVADGWVIDDVSISDAPAAVTLSAPAAQAAPNHDQIKLAWTESSEVGFVAYEIRRATSAGVTSASDLVASISDKSTKAYTNAGLPQNTTFYYKVFVLNTHGVRTGSNEGSAKTNIVGAVPFPL